LKKFKKREKTEKNVFFQKQVKNHVFFSCFLTLFALFFAKSKKKRVFPKIQKHGINHLFFWKKVKKSEKSEKVKKSAKTG